MNLGSIQSHSSPRTETKMPPVHQERSFLANFLAFDSFATARFLFDHISIQILTSMSNLDLALVDYKVSHTLSIENLDLGFIFLHFQAPCCEIEINYLVLVRFAQNFFQHSEVQSLQYH